MKTKTKDAPTAADVMTREVRTVPADATLRETAEMLNIHGIGGAPVVDAAGSVVGMISESDLINAAKKRAALPHVAAFGAFLAPEESVQRIYKDGMTLLAEEVMSRKVVGVPPDAPLSEVGDLMLRHKVNRVPVLGEDGALLGIVTRTDVLRGLFGLGD
jgi:CBS domain-containing protein